MPPTIVARRWFYRLASTLLQIYWFIARPSVTGVKFVITDRDRVLLVRHTYGPRSWDVPGGALKRQESPLSAAQREAAEELGVVSATWHDIGRVTGQVRGRRDTILCFSAEVHDPELSVDLGEIDVAQWFPRTQLPRDIGRYVPKILALLPAV